MKRRLSGILLVFCLFFGGCMQTEVEEREFPVVLTIKGETENFVKDWRNNLKTGTKKKDYNHLKVIVIERAYLEQTEKMNELLTLLKQEKDVPLNAYVVTAEDADALKKAQENLNEPLGNYIEELLEHSDEIKKETYPTIGMLYQEKENRMETLFLPYLSLVEGKPEVTAYEAYKRGTAEGTVETDAALLSFFTANQMKKYELQLEENLFAELSHTKNEISFENHIEKSGLIKKRVCVNVRCDGRLFGQAEEEKKAGYEQQIADYMTGKSKEILERGIDLTNSRKKLGGGMREWYDSMQDGEAEYEEEIEIIFTVKINWTD